MKRPFPRWLLVLAAVPLALWGIAEILDRRPNPILVTQGPDPEEGLPAPATPAPLGGAPALEVVVARTRPIRMRVFDSPVRGMPGMPAGTLPTADADAVAAEEKELRAALERWRSADGRSLRVSQSWISGEISSGLFGPPQRCRVVLNARLVPGEGK